MGPKQKVWWIPHTEDQLNGILGFFKGKVGLDYSQFHSLKPIPSIPKLPTLTERIAGEVKAFEDWMRNRRYSESTIKNYTGGISLSFRFTGNKNPEQITNEDLESFHKNYIISRKYSASF